MDNTVWCVGGVTVDRKLKSIKPLIQATSNLVNTSTTIGGVAHNVALNLCRAVSAVRLQSVVGDDAPGHLVRTHCRQFFSDSDILVLKDHKTAQYDAILDASGELYLALADMAIFDHIPPEAFTNLWHAWASADWVFLDTNLPASLLEKALHLARSKGIRVGIDPVSVHKSARIPMDLSGVFFIKPDRLEAEAMTGIRIDSPADALKAGKALRARGVSHAVITLGSAGHVLVSEDTQRHFPAASRVQINDVTGAGDAFVAGILSTLHQGGSMLEACEAGAQYAHTALTREASSEEAVPTGD